MATAPPLQSAQRFTLIVMGVSGSGKTTVGLAIAKTRAIAFFDGDDLHSPAARAKMTAGARRAKSRYCPASAPPASERRGSRGKTANPGPIASGVGASNNAIVDAAPSTGRKP